MSQRHKTVPSTRKHSRSSSAGREELIAKEKTKKQSAKKRTALDNHFYRTSLRFTGANRDAEKCSACDAATQRFASGATAELDDQSLNAPTTDSNLAVRVSRPDGTKKDMIAADDTLESDGRLTTLVR